MTYQVDTSGEVRTPTTPRNRPGLMWGDLSPFAQGYTAPILESVGAAFWMLAPETLARIIADCEAFQAKPETVEHGRRVWSLRQAGSFGAGFEPQTVQLCDDGKVRFA